VNRVMLCRLKRKLTRHKVRIQNSVNDIKNTIGRRCIWIYDARIIKHQRINGDFNGEVGEECIEGPSRELVIERLSRKDMEEQHFSKLIDIFRLGQEFKSLRVHGQKRVVVWQVGSKGACFRKKK